MADGREDESGDDGVDRAWGAGLEVLLDLVASVIEDAHEVGTAAVASDPEAQLRRIVVLRQAGNDLVVLASACEVLVRRQQGR